MDSPHPVDPDNLFVQFTIPEIRNIQTKLRADADAKQEELRLMVGERYRDLLKASTSIISIGESSKRVMGFLTEMREAMVLDGQERKPRSVPMQGGDDAHLKVLQSLAAHLKLLLDAPEHLWRLLEKKQYLQAAWLFLFARVVYRSLVSQDQDESWESRGIDISLQFPLVQRQWDTVTQFRSQIVHRATQYLREHPISPETACCTILTLHLLDSLPLSETLSTLLSQRSRTFNIYLLRGAEAASIRTQTQLRGAVVKDVRTSILELLDVIIGTLRITRATFHSGDDDKSLVERSLEEIQSETSSAPALTTSSLLSTLPSSAHLLTLPQSILSYKPYIDLTSPAAHVNVALLNIKLTAWFDKAIQTFEGRIHAWFEGLQTIREVWGVRRKVLERLQATRDMEEEEKMKFQGVLDEAVRDRAVKVLTEALIVVEEFVSDAFTRAFRDVKDGVEDTRLDILPSTFLFTPPSIPPSQFTSNSNTDTTSLNNFKDALRRRADSRTPILDRFLRSIETKLRELEEDLDVMDDYDESSGRPLCSRVEASYYPQAQLLLDRIIENMKRFISPDALDIEGDSEKSIMVVVFLGRIFNAMTSSTFGRSLRCQDKILQDFRGALGTLHNHTLGRWKTYVLSKSLEPYALLTDDLTLSTATDFAWPYQPTPQLINSLLLLASFLQLLGLSRDKLRSKGIIRSLVCELEASITHQISEDGFIWPRGHAQLVWDLTFLRRLSSAHGDSSGEIDGTLHMRLTHLQSHLRSSLQDETFSKLCSHIDRTVEQYVSRCQMLLAPFVTAALPLKGVTKNRHPTESADTHATTALLTLGTHVADQDIRPGMEIVKPSARFALLLVGSSV